MMISYLKLLETSKIRQVSIIDARSALEGIELSEDNYLSAVDHGVFNEPDAGTIVRSSFPSRRLDNGRISRLVGLNVDFVLGRFIELWPLQPLGSTTFIIIFGDDFDTLNYNGDCLP